MSAARRRGGGGGGAGWQELMRSCWRRTSLGRPRQTDGRRKSNNRQFCFCAGRNLPEHDRPPPARSSRRERRADGFLAPSPDVRGQNLSDARLSTAATDIFARITATARRHPSSHLVSLSRTIHFCAPHASSRIRASARPSFLSLFDSGARRIAKGDRCSIEASPED